MEYKEQIPQSPADYLAQNRHIREIRFPDKKDLEYQGKPIDEQISVLSEKLSKDKGFIAETFSRYIQLPIILDDFKDDKERNELEQTFFEDKKDVFDFYQSNKLRTTNIRNVLQLFDLLNEMGEVKSPQLKKQAEDIWSSVVEGEEKGNFEKYEQMSEEEGCQVPFSFKFKLGLC